MCYCQEGAPDGKRGGWVHSRTNCYDARMDGATQALTDPFCKEPCNHVSCNTVRGKQNCPPCHETTRHDGGQCPQCNEGAKPDA